MQCELLSQDFSLLLRQVEEGYQSQINTRNLFHLIQCWFLLCTLFCNVCCSCLEKHHFPLTLRYGATKAFLTNFASSFAIEALHNNVTVSCFHPQYTRTKLYDKLERLSVFDILERLGDEPREVAEGMLKAVGFKLPRRDFGWFSLVTRIFTGIWFDYNLITMITAI